MTFLVNLLSGVCNVTNVSNIRIMEKLRYLGPYIYYITEKRQLSQSAICSYAGISYLELNNIENGKYEPHPNTLKRICDFVGIDFVALFKKSERYKKLLDEMFHSLNYDIINDQKILMDKLDKINFEESILFPEYLLLKIIYMVINNPFDDQVDAHFKTLALFENVLSNDDKGLYYIYKGIYYRNRNDIEKAETYFELASNVSPFSYSELLYQHYGVLKYMQDKFMETLQFYDKAYILYEKRWNINRLLYTKSSIGLCYIGMRRYDMADEQLTSTLHLAKQYKNELVIQTCYEDLSYNYLLMRDYKRCIEYAIEAINAGSSYTFLYFYLSYSNASLGNTGEAALWSGKREHMEKDSPEYMCQLYVKMIFDQQEDVVFMNKLYEKFEHCELREGRVFLLEDIAAIYHEREDYKKENEILYKIINIIK